MIKPLPGLPIIRDLIVDMTQFFAQYHSVKPYVIDNTPLPERERLQSPAEREVLDGLYECILCAAAPPRAELLVEPDKFVGARAAAGVPLIADSRDQATNERLDDLEARSPVRCHTIMNCVDVCPKGLNPTAAIGRIKELLVRRAV